MVQRTSEKISELSAPTTLDQDFVVPVSDPDVASYKVRKDRFEPRFNVMDYGATGLGIADETAAFTLVLAAAALVGGTVFVPKGTYKLPLLPLPSGVSIEGEGDSTVLVNCYLSALGTAGSEIVFTAPANKGATSISIPATGLTGSWLRLSSCINMQSTDAGVNQLGHDASAMGFFSEYVQVLVGSAGSATLSGALVWPYSNTAGGDSGSFTTSVARVMSFHSGSRVRNLKFLGKNSAKNQCIEATFARDFIVENVTIDCNDITCQNIRLTYCFDCHVRGGVMIGKRNTVPSGSTANPIVGLSAQNCSVSGVTIYYGNQGVDFDAYPNDGTYRGGPSMFCSVTDSQAIHCATDGFTSHFGCYGSSFTNNKVHGSPRGIRLRGRADRCQGNILINGAGTGIGVFINNAAVVDAEVVDNVMVGYLYGIQFSHNEAGYATLEALLGASQCLIFGNRIRDSADYGIYCSAGYQAATLCGPQILGNQINGSTNHSILIESYVNGTIVAGNRIRGVPATKAGIKWEVDIKRLCIGENYIFGVNATGFGLVGAGIASFMTDAVTFPGGEAEALLYVARQHTDAATGFEYASIIRDVTAYDTNRMPGYGPFVSCLGTSGPTSGRQTVGFYLSGSSLRADTRDTSNAFVTHQLNIRGSGTPEGAVTAAVGSTYQRTDGGAGTSFYVKESGSGNTGWVAK